MATANKKKGKKSKVYLDQICKDEQQPPNTIKKVLDWGEEMEGKKLDSTFTYGAVTCNIVLPKAPRSAYDIQDLNQIPENPPYTAQLKNLPYEITNEQISHFLNKISIKDIKSLNRDKTKPSGIAYVEFESKEDLIQALKKADEKLMGRSIQIQVATSNSERRPNYNNNAVNDGMPWRSNNSAFSASRDSNRRGSYRDDYTNSNTGPNRLQNYDNSGGNARRAYAGSASTEYFRKNSYTSQYGNNNRMGDSSFPPNPLRHQTNDKTDNGGGAFTSRFFNSAQGQQQASRASVPLETGLDRLELTNSEGLPLKPGPAPLQRVKLELKPRSNDKKIPDSQEAPPPAQVKGRSYAAIFGGAKPVDTASVERAIEEKLLKQQQPTLTPLKPGTGGANNRERVVAGEKIISRSASLASFGQASDDGLTPTPAAFGHRGGVGPDLSNHRRSSGGNGHHNLPLPPPQQQQPGNNIYSSASSLISPLKPPNHPINGPPALGNSYSRQAQQPYQHYPSHPDNQQQQYGQGGGAAPNYRNYPRDPHPNYHPPGMPPMAPNDHYGTGPRHNRPGGVHRPYQGAKSMDYHRGGGGPYTPSGVPPVPPNARQGGPGGRYPNQAPPHQSYMGPGGGGGERRQSADTRNYDNQQRNQSGKRPQGPSNNGLPYYSSRPNSRPGQGGGYGANDRGAGGYAGYGGAGGNHQRSSQMMMSQQDGGALDHQYSDQSPYLSVAKAAATATPYDNKNRSEESTTPNNNGLQYSNKFDTLHNLEDE